MLFIPEKQARRPPFRGGEKCYLTSCSALHILSLRLECGAFDYLESCVT